MSKHRAHVVQKASMIAYLRRSLLSCQDETGSARGAFSRGVVSDELVDLDLTFDAVAEDTEELVILLSGHVLSRKWCAGR